MNCGVTVKSPPNHKIDLISLHFNADLCYLINREVQT